MIEHDGEKFIRFKGKDHSLKLLKLAIKKASIVTIEPGTDFHEYLFELEPAGEDTLSDSKYPIVTPFEGKMVVIGSTRLLPPEVYLEHKLANGIGNTTPPAERKNKTPFKAILVTKYNVNQTRYKEPLVDVKAPIYEPEPEVRRPFNPPKFATPRPSPGRVSQYGNRPPPTRK